MTVTTAGGAGSFEADVPVMQVAAGRVFEVNEAIRAELASLLQRLDPLMGTWQGGAAMSFHALKDRWHESATTLNQALLAIGEGLARAERTYRSSDEASQQDFAGIAGHLG